jgi:hypothetical protein
MVLVAAGEGSYFEPFHFEVTDALTKSLVEYFGALTALNFYPWNIIV